MLTKRSILKRKMRINRGKGEQNRLEWALMSKKSPRRVLRWFGPNKPTKKEIAKEEARIHYFSK